MTPQLHSSDTWEGGADDFLCIGAEQCTVPDAKCLLAAWSKLFVRFVRLQMPFHKGNPALLSLHNVGSHCFRLLLLYENLQPSEALSQFKANTRTVPEKGRCFINESGLAAMNLDIGDRVTRNRICVHFTAG